MLLRLVNWDHPLLRMPGRILTPAQLESPEIQKLGRAMVEFASGDTAANQPINKTAMVGLHAHQVGRSGSLIVWDRNADRLYESKVTGDPPVGEADYEVVANGQIWPIDDETNIDGEACLSFPDLYAWVERPVRVRLTGIRLFTGEVIDEPVEGAGGYLARVLCHELKGHNCGRNITHETPDGRIHTVESRAQWGDADLPLAPAARLKQYRWPRM